MKLNGYLRIIGLILFSLVSQQSYGQKFDLLSLELPVSESSITSKIKIEDQKFQSVNLSEYLSLEKDALNFNGRSLYGSIDNSPDTSYLANGVKFYIDKKTNLVEAYRLDIKTTAETRQLEKSLVDKFGKTFYYYKDKDMNFRIWEYNGSTYFLEVNATSVYNGQHTISGNLCVISNRSTEFYNNYLAGGFGYYADYLRAKKNTKKKGYTYNDFLNEMKAEDRDYYLKKVVR
ncbi:hypothetical protein [Chryseobacterium sp. Leaf405]|uniref:hypothetical protein n=1 Tax=Chryseobacterium sp. Leaf405 TaxID=1736367 RepID=UPI0016170737|nr:hypothetical protein [Chryseobacterium sp. Leaf405]